MEKTGLKLTDLSDARLVAMALSGDGSSQAAYFTLYARYHVGVCTYIARFVQHREDIEDICIESFEKAFKHLPTYKPENKFSTWLLTIARNTALDHKDRQQTRGRNMKTTSLDQDSGEGAAVLDDKLNPMDEIIDEQMHGVFVACMEGLPDLYREVARLCLIENMAYKEIAGRQGLPVNTVKTRIRRAKELITRMMLDMEAV